MSGPHPDKWGDLLRTTYGYPEDLDSAGDGLTGRHRRRAVRQARRQWRAEDHDARHDWMAQQRARAQEPASPEGRLGIVVVLAVVVGVVLIGGSVRSCQTQPAALAPSASTGTAASSQAHATASNTPDTSAPGTNETETGTSVATPEDIVTAWARGWLTFTATASDSQDAHLNRAAPYMTDELVALLAADRDPIAAAYLAEGTDVTLSTIDISGRPQNAPVDTDVRVTRLMSVTMSYTAGPMAGSTETVAYALTLTRPAAGQRWQVADFITGAD